MSDGPSFSLIMQGGGLGSAEVWDSDPWAAAVSANPLRIRTFSWAGADPTRIMLSLIGTNLGFGRETAITVNEWKWGDPNGDPWTFTGDIADADVYPGSSVIGDQLLVDGSAVSLSLGPGDGFSIDVLPHVGIQPARLFGLASVKIETMLCDHPDPGAEYASVGLDTYEDGARAYFNLFGPGHSLNGQANMSGGAPGGVDSFGGDPDMDPFTPTFPMWLAIRVGAVVPPWPYGDPSIQAQHGPVGIQHFHH